MSLLRSISLNTIGDYVLDVLANPSRQVLIYSTSANTVNVCGYPSLNTVGSLAGHTKVIHGIALAAPENIVLSASEDRTARLWDLRQMACVAQHQIDGEGYGVDIDAANNVFAVASEGDILLYDLRMNKELRSWQGLHSDVIRQISFYKDGATASTSSGSSNGGSREMFTAADDGLINHFDLSIEDDDDALISVMNVEDGISRFGSFAAGNQRFMFVMTHTHNMSLWNLETELKVCQDTGRNALNADYLVTAVFNPFTGGIHCIGGTSAGSIFIGRTLIGEGGVSTIQPEMRLDGGHTELVRSVWVDPNMELLVSGGEDGKLCLWRTAPQRPM